MPRKPTIEVSVSDEQHSKWKHKKGKQSQRLHECKARSRKMNKSSILVRQNEVIFSSALFLAMCPVAFSHI